jgi:hypothetical protein
MEFKYLHTFHFFETKWTLQPSSVSSLQRLNMDTKCFIEGLGLKFLVVSAAVVYMFLSLFI